MMPFGEKHRPVLASLLDRLLRQERPLYATEVGVATGLTSEYLLSRFPSLHLTMVDSWSPHRGRDKGKAETLKRTDFAKQRRTVIHQASPEAAVKVPDASQDLVFIDGDHRARGVWRDIDAWAPKVRPGGVLCGHDYDSPRNGKQWGVKAVVDRIARRRGWGVRVEESVWMVGPATEYPLGVATGSLEHQKRAGKMHQRSLIKLVNHVRQGQGGRLLEVAEVGCFDGDTSAVLLWQLDVRLTMVDPWKAAPQGSEWAKSRDQLSLLTQAEMDAVYKVAMDRTDFAADRRSVWHVESTSPVFRLSRPSFDLVFIDAEHTEAAVNADIATWWPLVRMGGILSGHDYGSRKYAGVKKAVDEWAAREGVTLHLGMGKVWWARKTR